MSKRSVVLLLSISSILALLFVKLSQIPETKIVSTRILDRNGVLLREISSTNYGTAYPVKLENLPASLISTVIHSEDKRFFYHLGIDPFSVLRAAHQNWKAKKVISGGSTITQQLVRNIYNYPRTLSYKILESFRAFCVELRYSKKWILQEYLNRIPYGNGAFGIEAASKLYFEKSASDLTLAEIAFLSAIPSATKIYDPYRNFHLTQQRQKRILNSLYKDGKIDEQEYQLSKEEKIVLFPKEQKFLAPHFCDWVISRYKDSLKGDVKTTLDYYLQREVEFIIKNHLNQLARANVTNAAALVIDNKNGDILSMVGSADYFNETNSGQVNGTLALRQPGSTIKPFVYGLAMESGLTAADTLADIESHILIPERGDFMPRNYDNKYHGLVRIRTALACSYNIATLNLADKLGPDAILYKLRQAGFYSLERDAKFYGPGLALGSGEVSLLELARAYSGLARGGRLKSLRALINETVMDMGSFFQPAVSYVISDILADNHARQPAFGESSPLNLSFKCSVKTGTSKNFRDNWAVGYTKKFTVAVWTGNFSGKPMYGVSGISGAAPIFRDIMILLEKHNTDTFSEQPAGLVKRFVCPLSGKRPNVYCKEAIEEMFLHNTILFSKCDMHRLYKIDMRNGLIANADCPQEYVQEKIYEIYPPEFAHWLKEAGIENPPLQVSMLDTQNEKQFTENARIAFPNNGDLFKIDPILRREYQVITLKPKLSSEIETLKWFINDKLVGITRYPFFYDWRLEEGEHTIYYIAEVEEGKKRLKSPAIKINVL